MRHSVRWLTALAAVMASALAQSPNATITGTITDSQGAVVPGVEVVARQVATNLLFRGVSNDSGVYVIPSLPIGGYEVSAGLAGFKSFRRADIVLEVGQRLRIDIALEVGDVAETITVAGEASRVQTEDSTLGATVERQRIDTLPLNGRNVVNLLKTVPGVQQRGSSDGFATSNTQAFSQIRFNGGPTYGNQIYLDGGTNTAPVHNEVSVIPLVDAVEEFRVETNAIKAEFGQSNGGIVNMVTKAGTNEFHGSLYEFIRNDALDARNAFATQRDPISGRIKPLLRYNQFGGTVGGPVLIPKTYNGRNRTFFFAGYEQWRHRSAQLRRGTVATPLERAGDFTNTRDATGRVIPIYDPATTRANPAGAGFVRDLFPGNTVPRNRMDPLSLRVLEYHPLPNATPDNAFTQLNNYLAIKTSPNDMGTSNFRLDHRFSEKDNVFARYSSTRNTFRNEGFGLGPADPAARYDQRDNHSFATTYSRTITPSILNEFRAAAIRTYLPFLHPSFDQGWPEKLGFPRIVPQDMFPPVQIAGLLSISNTGFSGGQRNSHSIQAVDNVTIIRGRHTIKTGFDQRWIRLNWFNRQLPSGRYDFNTALTGNPLSPAGTGIGLASYLLGEVGGGSQSFTPSFSFHNWTHGSFVQDDFRVTRRLTLNLGVRYDLVSAPVERWNRYSNFEPYRTNEQTGWNGVLTYAGVTRPREFVQRIYNKIGPRFGFAYDLTGKGSTVIRGGYGLIYAMVESGDTEGDTSNSLGFSSTTTFTPIGPNRAFRFSEGPAALIVPLGPAGGTAAFRGQNVRVQVYEAPAPYLQQWNFTIQRLLPGGWVATGSYAGNRGVKLFGGNYDLNQMDPANLSLGLALDNLVANPFQGRIATGPLAGATVTRRQMLRPLPDYLNVMTMANHGASSTYHSMQLSVEKRYSNGLTALIAFTGSKLINNSSSSLGSGGGGLAAAQADVRLGLYNRALDRGIDPDDVSRRLAVSAVYELPFGRGKLLLPQARGLLNAIVGGWQVNTVSGFESGTPLSVRGANNFTGINYPDVLRDPTLSRSERNVERWFDTTAFRNPPNFVIGNAPRTLPRTRGPGLIDVSLSAFKNFRVRERFELQFRAESFNALNHVNYNPPNTAFTAGPGGLNQSANFGRITSALNARSLQFGLRMVF